jgi:multimeric flavodoxin WrbA
MNITAILASPHGIKGNTSVLASWLLYEAEQAGARIAAISLSDCAVEPCLGCDTCAGGATCRMGDDFGLILRSAEKSDGIVLISPMHFFGCSASMKTFIDRSRSVLLSQQWAGKYGAVVMTSGGTDCQNAAEYLANFLRAAGCCTVGSVHAPISSWRDGAKREQSFDDARKLGRNLVRAIRTRQVFEEQQPVVEAYRDHLQCIGGPPSFATHGKSGAWVRWEKAS